jgi:hypothetical protein
MAWTNPRTFETGDLVDDDMFNAQLRDNLNELSTHVHNNAAGEGTSTLGDVHTITFDDVSSTPDAPAANDIKIYSESGVLKYRLPDGTVKTLATTTHTH